MSPEQKELVVVSLRSYGRTTLMCGDGTNDVGGLKAAHVGVALLSASESAVSGWGVGGGIVESAVSVEVHADRLSAGQGRGGVGVALLSAFESAVSGWSQR